MPDNGQWLKCNRTRGNPVPQPPISAQRRSPTWKYRRTLGTQRGTQGYATNWIFSDSASACYAV